MGRAMLNQWALSFHSNTLSGHSGYGMAPHAQGSSSSLDPLETPLHTQLHMQCITELLRLSCIANMTDITHPTTVRTQFENGVT